MAVNSFLGPYASGPGQPSTQNPLRSLSSSFSLSDVMQLYQFSAEKGDPRSLLFLGQIYYHGSNVLKQNFPLAISCFKKILKSAPDQFFGTEKVVPETQAEKDLLSFSADAAAYLGAMYLRGEGTTVDYEKGKKYIEYALKYENAISLFYYGLLHMKGTANLPKDDEKALQYLNAAIKKGSNEANAYAAEILLNKGEHQAAYAYFLKATRTGNILALYRISDMYLHGKCP